jgi:hypothetical protein
MIGWLLAGIVIGGLSVVLYAALGANRSGE